MSSDAAEQRDDGEGVEASEHGADRAQGLGAAGVDEAAVLERGALVVLEDVDEVGEVADQLEVVEGAAVLRDVACRGCRRGCCDR